MVDEMSNQTDRMGRLTNFDRIDKAGDSQYPTIWEYAETNNNDGELEQTVSCLKQTMAKIVDDGLQFEGAIKTYRSMQNSVQRTVVHNVPDMKHRTWQESDRPVSKRRSFSLSDRGMSAPISNLLSQYDLQNDFITQNVRMDREQQGCVTTIAEFARETSEPDHMPATRAVSYEQVHPVKRPTAYTRHSVAQPRYVIDKQVLNEQQANTVCNDTGSGLQTHSLVFGLSSNASGRKFKLKQHPSDSSTKLTTLTINRNPAASEKAVNKILSRKCSAKSKAGIKCRPLVHLPPEPLIDKSSERNTDCDFEEAKVTAGLLFRSRSSIHKSSRKEDTRILVPVNPTPKAERTQRRLSRIFSTEKSTRKSNKTSASHTTQSKACEKESGDDDGNDNSAQDGMKAGNTSLASNPLADTVSSSLSLTMEEFLFENAQQVEQLEPTTHMSIEEFLRESKVGTQSVTH